MKTYDVTVAFEENAPNVIGGQTARISVTHRVRFGDQYSREMLVAVIVRRVCARFSVEKILALEVAPVDEAPKA